MHAISFFASVVDYISIMCPCINQKVLHSFVQWDQLYMTFVHITHIVMANNFLHSTSLITRSITIIQETCALHSIVSPLFQVENSNRYTATSNMIYNPDHMTSSYMQLVTVQITNLKQLYSQLNTTSRCSGISEYTTVVTVPHHICMFTLVL